jgi:hypothetical protein
VKSFVARPALIAIAASCAVPKDDQLAEKTLQSEAMKQFAFFWHCRM